MATGDSLHNTNNVNKHTVQEVVEALESENLALREQNADLAYELKRATSDYTAARSRVLELEGYNQALSDKVAELEALSAATTKSRKPFIERCLNYANETFTEVKKSISDAPKKYLAAGVIGLAIMAGTSIYNNASYHIDKDYNVSPSVMLEAGNYESQPLNNIERFGELAAADINVSAELRLYENAGVPEDKLGLVEDYLQAKEKHKLNVHLVDATESSQVLPKTKDGLARTAAYITMSEAGMHESDIRMIHNATIDIFTNNTTFCKNTLINNAAADDFIISMIESNQLFKDAMVANSFDEVALAMAAHDAVYSSLTNDSSLENVRSYTVTQEGSGYLVYVPSSHPEDFALANNINKRTADAMASIDALKDKKIIGLDKDLKARVNINVASTIASQVEGVGPVDYAYAESSFMLSLESAAREAGAESLADLVSPKNVVSNTLELSGGEDLTKGIDKIVSESGLTEDPSTENQLGMKI